MKSLRLYLDTSVFGGYFDDEFSEETRLLFNKIKQGEFKIVISDLTLKELLKAPLKVKNLLLKLEIDEVEEVIVGKEEIDLAKNYIQEKVVGQTSFEDCIHIATATINYVDLLVSWNFKHIVNVRRIKGYNSVNLKNGFRILDIRSPKDLIYYED